MWVNPKLIHATLTQYTACHPSDLTAQITVLENCRKSRFDILGRLDRPLGVKILSYLDPPDIMTLRRVSSRHHGLTHEQTVWQNKCLKLDGGERPAGCEEDRLASDSVDW